MTYTFTGEPSDEMEAFFRLMKRAEEEGPDSDLFYRDALISLVALHDRQAERGPADPDALRRFRRDSGDLLGALGGKVTAYVQRAITCAEGADDSQWYELCMRRSVIQCLLEDYRDTPVADLVDPADLADLDAEVRRVGQEYGPMPVEWIPKGLPESHWWWTHPSEERK